MSDKEKLIIIKLLHTVIWIFFNLVLVFMFYVTLTDKIDYLFWIGLGLIVMECVILVLFDWTCPLTFLARRYSDSKKENFDIFLPNWLAKHNKSIYSSIFGLLVVLYLLNQFEMLK